jgi:hypothetical protein
MSEHLGRGDARPIQKRKVRANGWTKTRRETFLSVLADSCNVKHATAAAGMTSGGVYQLRKRDPAFAKLWADALEVGYDRLETALLERALIGVNAIDMDAVVDAADAGVPDKIVPGSGFTASSLAPGAVQLALALLNRHRRDGGSRPATQRGRWPTPEETDAALNKQLDALAKRLAKRGCGSSE